MTYFSDRVIACISNIIYKTNYHRCYVFFIYVVDSSTPFSIGAKGGSVAFGRKRSDWFLRSKCNECCE